MADAGAAQRPALRPTTAIWVAALGHLLNDMYGNVYPVVVPLLMGPLRMGVTAAAMVNSVNGLTAALLQPFWGMAADRRGGLRFLPYALLGGAAAVGLLGFSPSYPVLLFLTLAAAAGNSAYHPPAAALVHASSGTRKGAGMSVFMVAGNVGRSLGPALAALLALAAGVRGVGLVALPGVAVALWIGVQLGRMERHGARAPHAPAEEGAGGHGHGHAHAEAVPLRDLARLVRARGWAIVLLLLMSASRSIVTSAVIAFLPLRYHLSGGPVLTSSAFIAVMLLVGGVGNALGGTLSDRVPRTWVVAVASLLAAAAMALFVDARGVTSLVLLALAGFFAMSVSSVVIVLGQELFPDNVALASGIVLGWGNAAASLGVAALAVIAGRWGIDAALFGAAGVAAVGTPLALVFPRARANAVPHALAAPGAAG
ncbi:MAG: MFS transporter [Actinomycetia bacterium]|nr:MFS transporter [Actinomycetes bacterium]